MAQYSDIRELRRATDRADYCGTARDDVTILFLFEDYVRLIKSSRDSAAAGFLAHCGAPEED